MDIVEKRRQAVLAFDRKDYKRALELALEITPYSDPVAFYICAVINETVLHDLDKAYHYFDLARKVSGFHDAYNGCVRVILAQKKKNAFELANRYCDKAITESHDGVSYLLLGRLFEELAEPMDIKRARKMYVLAARHRAAWGMRKLAVLEFKYGSRVLGTLYHLVATLLFPIFRILFGKRALRTG